MKSGNWRLVVCGASHKTSSLEQREPIQIGADETAAANALFGGLPEVLESAIVSTCNRVEFYFVTGRHNDPFDVVAGFYREFRGLELAPYSELFHADSGRRAADHLFKVAAGIDSMVLGENQILGQVKTAYSSACAVKSPGKIIHRLFHQAFRVGKRVRTDTEVGKGACSVSTAAVEMLAADLESLKEPSIVFVGVNQMIDLAAKKLAQIDGARLAFANRTPEKATVFAGKFGARGFGLDRLPALISDADVIVSCTSSPDPVITRRVIDEATENRPDRRLIIMDMAIPRDVDAPKDDNSVVEVNDLEDVKRFVEDRQQQRELAIPQAEEIIERRLDEFDYWYGHVLHEPIYNGRSDALENIRREELAAIIDQLPEELQNQLNQATRRIVDRVIKVTDRSAVRRSE
jgi:glutamyl-tRNA reductase